MISDAELDQLVWDTVRRYGRKGMNEATVWAAVSPHVPGIAAGRVTRSVDRLIAGRHLYRDRRRTRTRTYLKAADPGPRIAAETAAPQQGLW